MAHTKTFVEHGFEVWVIGSADGFDGDVGLGRIFGSYLLCQSGRRVSVSYVAEMRKNASHDCGNRFRACYDDEVE